MPDKDFVYGGNLAQGDAANKLADALLKIPSIGKVDVIAYSGNSTETSHVSGMSFKNQESKGKDGGDGEATARRTAQDVAAQLCAEDPNLRKIAATYFGDEIKPAVGKEPKFLDVYHATIEQACPAPTPAKAESGKAADTPAR